jgi:hypothetical protein
MRVDSEDRMAAALYEVFIDGEKREDCLMADDEQGVAEVMVFDGDGKPIVNLALPRGVETKMVWGTVELRPTDPHQAVLHQLAAGRIVPPLLDKCREITTMLYRFETKVSFEALRRMDEELAWHLAEKSGQELVAAILAAWEEVNR